MLTLGEDEESESITITATSTADGTKKGTATLKALPITYNVTLTVNDAEMGKVVGGKEYKIEETASVTATANEWYEFVNWTEGGTEVSTDVTYEFTVTKNTLLTANFKKNDSTGIEESEVSDEDLVIKSYDLTGRVVGEDYKGIVIKNGEVMLRK